MRAVHKFSTMAHVAEDVYPAYLALKQVLLVAQQPLLAYIDGCPLTCPLAVERGSPMAQEKLLAKQQRLTVLAETLSSRAAELEADAQKCISGELVAWQWSLVLGLPPCLRASRMWWPLHTGHIRLGTLLCCQRC